MHTFSHTEFQTWKVSMLETTTKSLPDQPIICISFRSLLLSSQCEILPTHQTAGPFCGVFLWGCYLSAVLLKMGIKIFQHTPTLLVPKGADLGAGRDTKLLMAWGLSLLVNKMYSCVWDCGTAYVSRTNNKGKQISDEGSDCVTPDKLLGARFRSKWHCSGSLA